MTRPVTSLRAARLRAEIRLNGSVIGEVSSSRCRRRRRKLVVERDVVAKGEIGRIEIEFLLLGGEPSDNSGHRRSGARLNLCLVGARIDYD
jgi:hypothetical protein